MHSLDSRDIFHDMAVGMPRRNYVNLELFVHDTREPQDVRVPYKV
jgi:hypothetical protein